MFIRSKHNAKNDSYEGVSDGNYESDATKRYASPKKNLVIDLSEIDKSLDENNEDYDQL
jgi:hypothetical protein